jgi:hypothetical protein
VMSTEALPPPSSAPSGQVGAAATPAAAAPTAAARATAAAQQPEVQDVRGPRDADGTYPDLVPAAAGTAAVVGGEDTAIGT